jgi:hypothetical protein
MIITKLKGGLGNQMFQYAVGRQLALTLGVPLKLDISYFHKSGTGSYKLDSFNIQEFFATKEEIELLTGRPILIKRIIKRLLGNPQPLSPSHIREIFFHFDPAILTLADNIYLEGYWQSAKYFTSIAPFIRNEFTLKNQLSTSAAKIRDVIENSNSISIHIRRGDYISNPDINQLHGVCSADYYHKCIEFFYNSLDDPMFFIFSDDLSWSRKNISIDARTEFVETHSTVEDFWLMKSCRHHIIANSTFSWWSAWLDDRPDSITFAPAQWFKDILSKTEDLFPSSWSKV